MFLHHSIKLLETSPTLTSGGVKVCMIVFCILRTKSLFLQKMCIVSFVVLKVQTQSRGKRTVQGTPLHLSGSTYDASITQTVSNTCESNPLGVKIFLTTVDCTKRKRGFPLWKKVNNRTSHLFRPEMVSIWNRDKKFVQCCQTIGLQELFDRTLVWEESVYLYSTS